MSLLSVTWALTCRYTTSVSSRSNAGAISNSNTALIRDHRTVRTRLRNRLGSCLSLSSCVRVTEVAKEVSRIKCILRVVIVRAVGLRAIDISLECCSGRTDEGVIAMVSCTIRGILVRLDITFIALR